MRRSRRWTCHEVLSRTWHPALAPCLGGTCWRAHCAQQWTEGVKAKASSRATTAHRQSVSSGLWIWIFTATCMVLPKDVRMRQPQYAQPYRLGQPVKILSLLFYTIRCWRVHWHASQSCASARCTFWYQFWSFFYPSPRLLTHADVSGAFTYRYCVHSLR